MTNNKDATRYYSSRHEESIAKALGGKRRTSSGSSKFQKGDIIHESADMLIEAKCSMKPKTSFSIKKEWLEKNKEESFSLRKSNSAVCFNFEPEGNNYYIINEKLMKVLINHLISENNDCLQ